MKYGMRKADVLAALARHIGQANGISAEDLVQEIIGASGDCDSDLFTTRRLRNYISELREEGVAVCGHPRTGYYIAETADELTESCNFLRARAMHSLTLESRLRRIPLPDLLGQLRVPT